MTGRKPEQKYYRTHSGYVGGMKETQYKQIDGLTNPSWVVQLAVRGMLPKNSLGRKSLNRLKVYAGPEHEQQSQKPEIWAAE